MTGVQTCALPILATADGNEAVIASGLKAGDQVVAAGVHDGLFLHARLPITGMYWIPLVVPLGCVSFALVLVLPPRQRQEARSLLARAVDCCAPGGTLVACMANDEGARSGESDLKALAGRRERAAKQGRWQGCSAWYYSRGNGRFCQPSPARL